MVADKRSDKAHQDRRTTGASCQEAVFQLAEVMVTREMFGEMLEKTGRLRFNPG
jgi:hypothetical protein